MKNQNPKLKIVSLGWDPTEQIIDFEQGRYLPYENRDLLIVAGDRLIRSFDDLCKLSEECFSGQAYIDIKLLPTIVGG